MDALKKRLDSSRFDSDIRDNATQASSLHRSSTYSGTTVFGGGSSSRTTPRPKSTDTLGSLARPYSPQFDDDDEWTSKFGTSDTVPPHKALVHRRPTQPPKRIPPLYPRPQLELGDTTEASAVGGVNPRLGAPQSSQPQPSATSSVPVKLISTTVHERPKVARKGKKSTGADSRGSTRQARGEDELRRQSTRSGGPEERSTKAIDIVTDPSMAAKDIVVRLQLPIEEDYDDELEVFSHLWRVGRFRDAEDYFQVHLQDLRHIPFVLLQHANMFLACGNYTKTCDLVRHAQPLLPNKGRRRGDGRPDKLSMSFELLELLSQPQSLQYAPSTLAKVVDYMPRSLPSGETMSSTDASFQQVNLIRELAGRCCNWKELYQDLLAAQRIWDFRDLFYTMITLFGWQGVVSLFFDVATPDEALDIIFHDWSSKDYDASLTLGLLDLFTGLLLSNPQGYEGEVDPPAALLISHAKTLALSIQQHDAQGMKTRPFILYILANILVEVHKDTREQIVDKDLTEGYTAHRTFSFPPIFVPTKHPEEPTLWKKFVLPSTDLQRKAANVALQAAIFTGDLRLQALSRQILIQQAEIAREARPLIDALSHLQLDEQGDRYGYLSTCLSFKYRALAGTGEEASLLDDFQKLDDASGGSYVTRGTNSTLLWARSMIQGYIEAVASADDAPLDPTKRCKDELQVYGTRLGEPIVRFLDQKFGIAVPRSPRVSFDHTEGPEPTSTDYVADGTPKVETLETSSSWSGSADTDDSGSCSSALGYNDSDLDPDVRRWYGLARESREQSYVARDSEFSGGPRHDDRDDLWESLEERLEPDQRQKRQRRSLKAETLLHRRGPPQTETKNAEERPYFEVVSDDAHSFEWGHSRSPPSAPRHYGFNPFRPPPVPNNFPVAYHYLPPDYIPPYPSGTQNGSMPPYFPVAGWPSTWQQDAAQMLGNNVYPQIQQYGAWDSSGGTGGYNVTNADQTYRSFFDTEAPQTGPLYMSNDQPKFRDVPATDSDAGSEGDEPTQEGSKSPRMGTENGLPKLDFPPSLLEDSTLTVFVRNKTDPQKARAYRIEQTGVFEAPELVKTGTAVRQPSPPPVFKRRHSQHGVISATPPPQPPNAPHPPRATPRKKPSAPPAADAAGKKATGAEPENPGKKDEKGKGVDPPRPNVGTSSDVKPTEADPSEVTGDSAGKANHAYVETEGESEEGVNTKAAVATETIDDGETIVEQES
ncbi:hypothetical protein OQA88_6698 [Cercophora sp. LCS_1]